MIRLLIVDDNELIRELLDDIFSEDEEIEVSGLASNGEEALAMIRKQQPDIVLLDVVMPKLDGCAVLDTIREDAQQKQPVVIMISALGSESVTGDAMARGADYYLMKPFNRGSILRQVRHVYELKTAAEQQKLIGWDEPKSKEEQASRLLQELGVPANVKGFQYIREGMMLCLENRSAISSITKLMYPQIGEKYGTTVKNVERGIRNAIKLTYERGNQERLRELFASERYRTKYPTCAEFIGILTETLRY